MSLPLLLPLIAGLVYACATLLIKRASDLGVGVWRSAFVANVVAALCFQPLLLLGGTIHPELWWQPVIVGLSFSLGQGLMFVSFDKGDVSVATPMLGLKILLVAGLVTLLDGTVLRWQLWVAAVLATAGVALLNRGGGQSQHHRVGRTILTAGLAALVFAVFDVLLQKWVPAWGVGRFLPLAMGASGIFSLGFIFRFRAPLRAIAPVAWRWLLGGSFILAAQSVTFVGTIAHYGNAAAANVVYSSRGLWTIVLIWAIGHWFTSREQHLGRKILLWRLAGAVLMMSAIVLVLVR